MKKHLILDHPVFFATVVLYLVYISLFLSAAVLNIFLEDLPLDKTAYTSFITVIVYLLTGSVLLFLMKHSLNPQYHFFRNMDRFMEAIGLLWPCVLVILLNVLPSIADGDEFTYHGLTLFAVILENLFVGYFEEITYRGTVISNAMRVWKDKKNKVIYSVLLSAIPFSLMHLMNIAISGVGVTLLQVSYAVGFGMIFAAVYLRTGNLFSCVLVHGLVDVSAALFETGTQEVNIESIVILLGVTAVYIAYALFLLRKRKAIETEFESI